MVSLACVLACGVACSRQPSSRVTGQEAASAAARGSAPAVALHNPEPGSRLFVGANYWNIEWEPSDNFFKTGTDFATTTDPWRPELLADLAPYHVLRFMDWNLNNDPENPQASWQTRKPPTAAQGWPVAFEWQIDLCNRTQNDLWLTIPHQSEADPQYTEKLASLVKDKLDPKLRVYVEWSNEVWNGIFKVHEHSAARAKALGLPGEHGALVYQVYASVRAYEAFEKVFGKDSPRVVKVLSGQAVWSGPCEAHVEALEDSKVNPRGTRPDVYAIAPYVGGNTIEELSAHLSEVNGWIEQNAKCASKAGLKLIAYEGGTDSFGAGNERCLALQHDPAMRGLYKKYLDTLAAAGLTGPFMHYTHTGGCWGLKQKTGEPVDQAPKYAGMLDWIAANEQK